MFIVLQLLNIILVLTMFCSFQNSVLVFFVCYYFDSLVLDFTLYKYTFIYRRPSLLCREQAVKQIFCILH